jgi:hypothetical protein
MRMPKPSKQTQSKRTLKPIPTSTNGDPIEMQTTAIHITKDMWNLLREVAFHRAQSSGGRASVSDVLRNLVESHRAELEKEIAKK